VPDNQWVHVATTYDGATLRYWINGVLDSVGTSINSNYPFAGVIDEVFFFSEARTAQELALDMTIP
jgi:hypothetical protein